MDQIGPWRGGSAGRVEELVSCPWTRYEYRRSYSFTQGVLDVVAQSQYDQGRLDEIAQVILSGKNEGASPESVVDEMAKTAPELAVYFRRAVAPETWVIWLTLLYMILQSLTH